MQQPNEISLLNRQTSPRDIVNQHHSGNRNTNRDLLRSSYPSPPMSRPTTPAQDVSEKQIAAVTTSTSASEHAAQVTSTVSTILPQSRDDVPVATTIESEIPTVAAESKPTDLTSTQNTTTTESPSILDTALPSTTVESDSAVAGPSTTRPTRKAKQHVASACVNCKRAHLSCDVHRPCQRCINTGKQDSCHDVQHKKRGRPRLREDTDIVLPSSSTQPIAATIVQHTQHRPIASTRSRRAESFRSHQSRGSESSSYGPVTPNSATFSPLYAPYQFMPGNILPAFETPTALLDLDLRVLRFNPSFQHIVGGGRSLLSIRLTDVVRPVDNSEPLLSMRDRLRAEREQREPAFLPPIVQSGRDPFDSVQDSDLDRLTQGYSDVTYSWMFQTTSSPAITHPVRVRLGKALTYFVAVTLQPMQIARPALIHTTPAPLAMSTAVAPDIYGMDRQTIVPSAGLLYDQVLFTSPRATHYSTAASYQYAQHQQQQPPVLIQPVPSQHFGSTPVEAPPQQVPVIHHGQPYVRLAADPRLGISNREQLPPIAETTTATSRLTTHTMTMDEPVSSDDVDDEQAQTAKRRRGMGIDDVLQ